MASVAPELPVLARDEAFERLYRRYVKDVYHYALALLRNPADAEDVTQTTFMNAYRAYRRGDEIEKPQNWLIKIAHNVARTRYARASRRVKEVPLDEHVDQLALPEDEKPNIEGILRALGRLPFNQRAALVMRELEGRSYVEIADTLGVSVSAVETLIFRARRSLKVRASALRALTAVPLPGSLAGFVEGGTLAAGGGAITGGFVLKAAVAVVAGAFATGLAGESAENTIAAKPNPDLTAQASGQAGAPSGLAKQAVNRGTGGAGARVTRRANTGRAAANAATVERTSRPTLSGPTGTAPVPSGTPAQAPRQSSPAAAASKAAAPVTNTVAATQETVAAAVPSLPVKAPALPNPPVKVPDPRVKVPDPPVKVPDPPVKVPDPPVKVPDPPVKVPDPPVKVPDPPVKLPDPPKLPAPPKLP